jgi:hypothetical protein
MDSMPTVTGYKHVSNGHRMPVLEPSKFIKFLVRDHLERGLNAAELLEQHPHLTLGQIFSALAYDWDHQSEMDVLLAGDELETKRLLDRVELEGRLNPCFRYKSQKAFDVSGNYAILFVQARPLQQHVGALVILEC